MSAIVLPLKNDPTFYKFQVELDSKTYGFEFRWNYVTEAWYFSIFTSDDQPIICGIKVAVDWPLAARYADVRLPPGILIAQDTTGARQDPGLADLGTRVQMLYFDQSEIGS